MAGRQATVAVVLSVILAACGAGATPTLHGRATSTPSGGPSAAASAAPSPTDAPTTPTPTPEPTADAKPPKPTSVKFKLINDVETETGIQDTYRVTWKTPRTEGVEIRVYGVTECLSEPTNPKAGASGPCLVPHTRLPKRALTLIGVAPASAGRLTWTWDIIDGCDVSGDYISRADPASEDEQVYAVVVAAHNTAGNSVFAIAWPGEWSNPVFSEGDMPC